MVSGRPFPNTDPTSRPISSKRAIRTSRPVSAASGSSHTSTSPGRKRCKHRYLEICSSARVASSVDGRED
eukprot:25561-Eustigmatos_ZCMA.PRE.1